MQANYYIITTGNYNILLILNKIFGLIIQSYYITIIIIIIIIIIGFY